MATTTIASTKPADASSDLKTRPLPDVEKMLGSSANGLSQAEAARRLVQYGPNEIAEKKTSPILKFLLYFWGPIPWMIEVAVVLSGVVQHWPDFFIILVLLIANATIGFWEERQAGNAIDALKAKLAIKARVKRDGKWVTPAAKELVPGDVIRLRLGDIVPADARLLDGRRDLRRSIRPDGGVAARHAKCRRRGVLRFDRSSRRGWRAGLRHGRKNLFRQDGRTRAERTYGQPFPESCAEDRQLPDHPRSGPGGSHHWRRRLSWRPDPDHTPVRPRY